MRVWELLLGCRCLSVELRRLLSIDKVSVEFSIEIVLIDALLLKVVMKEEETIVFILFLSIVVLVVEADVFEGVLSSFVLHVLPVKVFISCNELTLYAAVVDVDVRVLLLLLLFYERH